MGILDALKGLTRPYDEEEDFFDDEDEGFEDEKTSKKKNKAAYEDDDYEDEKPKKSLFKKEKPVYEDEEDDYEEDLEFNEDDEIIEMSNFVGFMLEEAEKVEKVNSITFWKLCFTIKLHQESSHFGGSFFVM